MRVLPVALAGLLAALLAGEAGACRCAQGITERLYPFPGSSRAAALVRARPETQPGVPPAPEATGPGWVELEGHALLGKNIQRYRSRGTSCDLRVPAGGWFLLLTQGDPDMGLSLCDSVLVPLEEAGPLLARLLPDDAWTRCRTDAACAASTTPGCLPPLSVRRGALGAVKTWRRAVAQALRCEQVPPAVPRPALRPACLSGTCGFAPPPGK